MTYVIYIIERRNMKRILKMLIFGAIGGLIASIPIINVIVLAIILWKLNGKDDRKASP